jgi:hypothetical protein
LNTDASDNSQPVRLPNTLSPRQLTAGLILLTLIPFLFVVVLYMTLPTSPDPVLQVELKIGPRPWQSNDGTETRLLPSLIVHNPTADAWNNVNFAINSQFYYYHAEGIKPDEELIVPLKFFHTKGNQFYPPESQPLKSVTVYAQIPSGARAIKEVSGQELSAPELNSSNQQ